MCGGVCGCVCVCVCMRGVCVDVWAGVGVCFVYLTIKDYSNVRKSEKNDHNSFETSFVSIYQKLIILRSFDPQKWKIKFLIDKNSTIKDSRIFNPPFTRGLL